MSIAEILLEKGLVSTDQLAEAVELRKSDGVRLDRALVQLGYVEPESLLDVLSEQFAIEVVEITGREIDVETLQSLPSKLVYKKHIIPLERTDKTLTVATSDPYDLYAFDEIRLLTGLQIIPVLAIESEIDQAIRTFYGLGGDTVDEMMMSTDDIDATDTSNGEHDLIDVAQEASVIKLVNEIFIEAIEERASDIHIEPYERGLSIRYRIDGVLQDAVVPPQIMRFQAAIISRIKIMSGLNIAEKRLPQDGRIKLQSGGKQVDIRVSIIPMLFGEGVVMRILDKSTVQFTLPELGMAGDTFTAFERFLEQPHGILLVTGPTGSGKTTTLYAALQAIVGPGIKVLTVEDPVEYHLDGVNQIQVNPKIDYTFARGLRAILRHDPDVVMIGEIRDGETAQAAIQASLTGHLVFSTLHTNDACSAATRLLDMGVEPFLVSSTLEASLAQRLVRTICPDCKVSYTPDLKRLPSDLILESGQMLYRGEGCRKCRLSGYRGRAGLFELMSVSDEIRDGIMHRESSSVIRGIAKNAGMRFLRDDGWDKVRAGITTVQEVLRATKA